MGFFGKDDEQRWVDSDDLKWSPDSPLFYGQGFSTDESLGNFAPSRPADEVAAAPAPPTPPPTNRLWLPRIAIGFAQGALLLALMQARDHNIWPGNDGYLFGALSLAGIFAPLLLLEGLGEIPLLLLSLWTAIAAGVLGCLGLYHHWRIADGDPSHAGLALMTLVGVALCIAQVLLRAGVRDNKLIAAYRTCFEASWTLAARLLVWAAITGAAWAVFGSLDSAVSWQRAHYPDLHMAIDPTRLVLPLVGVASAAGFALTAGNSKLRRLTRKMLLACFTIALPVAIVLGAALTVAQLVGTPPAGWMTIVCAALLLVGFNASYRSGARRGRIRRICEIIAAVLIAALSVFAALALHDRIALFGLTPTRLYAALAITFLGAYGIAYCCAGLIGIGGGRWMQRVEIANRVLAAGLVASCLLLCTPLADPLQQSVAAQARRLDHGADPAAFDFAWLKRDGARFGHAALAQLSHAANPEVARDATVTLAAAPGDAPPPSQIGANITVRTQGARIPNDLLNHDWSKAPSPVPPCLTHAALACDAWFLDLDHDGVAEILLVYGNDTRWWAGVMKRDVRGGWRQAATFTSPTCRGSLSAMRGGNLFVVDPAPTWQDLLIAGFRITATGGPKPELPCPR